MTAAKEKTAPKTAAEATAKTAGAATAAFPNFGTLEVPAAFREMAEKNVMKAKEAYDSYKSLAEDATDALEDTFASINKGTNDFQAKALGVAKAQFNAGFDFVEKMIGVKSLAEAIEIQSEFARKQFDALTEQAKEFQALASRVQSESTKPFKDGIAKAMNHWKAAF
ncbi:phasin [Tepidamorphus gemmatus]|uniref:Phasin n=1 Tax=Tepidamorphus gemmatus TaxID=747076 RepID=A0A4R3MEI4_9HYPH|nr:phasin [Tepidamorphus gemmatus]TCT12060.1 phasin [Tepidamorphus gemmatus]